MANSVFSEIDTFLNDFLTDISTQVQNLLSNEVGALISSSVILYIVFYGYMILAGKVQTPLSDTLWNLTRLAIIIAFVKNEGGILTNFNEAVKSLSEIGGNGKSVLINFDELFSTISEFADRVADNGDWYEYPFLSILIWIGFILMSIPITLTFLLSKITLYLLLALSPIFFFMLMWGWLKDSFANFVSALLSNAMALVILNAMVSVSITFIKKHTNLDGNPWLVSFSFIIIGIIAGLAIRYIVNVTNTVMRVSVERAGAGVVGVYKGVKNAIQAPFTPTQNSISRANFQANQSQVATQQALQELAKKIGNSQGESK